MASLSEFRENNPEYDDMSDTDLADALHRKFYSDMPRADFMEQVGVSERPDTYSGVGMNASAGLSDSAFTMLGAPVDLFRTGVNAAAGAAEYATGADLPRYPEGTVGSSEWLREQAGSIDPRLNPDNVKATDAMSGLARSAGIGAGAVLLPGAAASGATRAGSRGRQVTDALFGDPVTGGIRRNAAAGAAGGVGGTAGAGAAPEGYEDVGAAVGGIVGGGMMGAATAKRPAGGGRKAANIEDKATQEDIARSVVARTANLDDEGMATVTRNLREAEARRTGNARDTVPGFRQFMTDAAREPGIANYRQQYQSYGQMSALPPNALRETNQREISRRVSRLGGSDSAVEAASDRVNQQTRSSLDNLGLGSIDDVDVSGYLNDIDARIASNSTGENVIPELRDIKKRIQRRAKPVKDENGEIIGYTMNADGLQQVRKYIASRQYSPDAKHVDNQSGLDRETRGALGDEKGVIDEILDDVTGGAYREEYLNPTKELRNTRDAKSFMNQFGLRVQDKDKQYLDTGERSVNFGTAKNTLQENRSGRRMAMQPNVPGYNTTMRDIERTSPGRARFLDNIMSDLERASYAGRTVTQGSPTERNQNFTRTIDEEVAARLGPGARAMRSLEQAGQTGSNITSSMLSPTARVVGKGFRTLASKTGDAYDRQMGTGRDAVQATLGAMETDTGYAASVLGRPPVAGPQRGPTRAAAADRAAGPGGVGGFMENREHERRRRNADGRKVGRGRFQ